MEITLNTPALLFPAISLILLAFTNRFNTLASLIRSLHAKWQETHDADIHRQLRSLRLRTRLIRDMQGLGVSSMLLCVLCMFLIYLGHAMGAAIVFGASLVVLLVSLGLSVWEVWISTDALQLELADMEEVEGRAKRVFRGSRNTGADSRVKSRRTPSGDESDTPNFTA